METELLGLDQNHAWSLVDLPPDKSIVGYKWVYKIKHKVDGTIERHKARLKAKGCTQLEGVDFFDTCFHVSKLTIVRVLLALAVIQN